MDRLLEETAHSRPATEGYTVEGLSLSQRQDARLERAFPGASKTGAAREAPSGFATDGKPLAFCAIHGG